MAPKKLVLRRPAASAASGRPGHGRQHVVPAAAWTIQPREVVYISKVRKCDSSFLILLGNGHADYRKLFVDSRFLRHFQTFSEDTTHYTPHYVSVKIPRNGVAYDELPGDEYLGYLYAYHGTSPNIKTKQEVVMLAEDAEYPLV